MRGFHSYRIYKNTYKTTKTYKCPNCKREIKYKGYFVYFDNFFYCLICGKGELEVKRRRIGKTLSDIKRQLKWIKDNPKESIIQKLG